MFFLLDLDLKRTPHLKAVQQYDDLEVLRVMQGKLTKRNGRLAWPTSAF